MHQLEKKKLNLKSRFINEKLIKLINKIAQSIMIKHLKMLF